jgi:hypothetical protein
MVLKSCRFFQQDRTLPLSGFCHSAGPINVTTCDLALKFDLFYRDRRYADNEARPAI